MHPSLRSCGIFLFCAGLLGFRAWRAELDFKRTQSLFPSSQKGLFRGWVEEEPEVIFDRREGGRDTGRGPSSYRPFVREVRALCRLESWEGKEVPKVRVRVTFRLAGEGREPLLSCGDPVEVRGRVQAPPPALNPGQFDYANFLKGRDTAYVAYVAPGHWDKLAGPPRGSRLLRFSCLLKRRVQDSIYSLWPYPQNALLDGLLLGDRGPLPSPMVEDFMATGTVHILAVSGMMTAFIAGILFMVLRAAQVPRKAAAALAMAALVLFILMTGAHPPVCRAGLFSILALASVLFERRVHGGRLLAVTAAVLVLANPLVLGDLSFQISFLATAGLMAFSARILKLLRFLWEPAALLVTSTAAAQASVWCLLIYSFNQASLYSPLANLAVVPLALFSAAGGLTAIAGGLVHPWLGKVFAAACLPAMKLLVFLAGKMSLWPGAQWVVASPPAAWTLSYHALFLGALAAYWPVREPQSPSPSWEKKAALRMGARKWVLGLGAFFLAGSSIFLLWDRLGPQPLRFTFLAVGHGEAVVLRTPDRKVLVYDGGKGTQGPDRYHPLVAYLRHEGLGRVDGILNSHPDSDHVGGLVNLLRAMSVSRALVSPQAKGDTEVYRAFEKAVADEGLTLTRIGAGGTLPEEGVSILHPPADFSPRLHADNNLSLTALVSFGGRTALLPGDLEKEGLLRISRSPGPLPQVDWLLAPHHGRPSGEQALCAKLFHPRFVVLSDWKDYPEAREQYQTGAPGSMVLSTAEEGAVEVEVRADGGGRYRCFRRGTWIPFGPAGRGGLKSRDIDIF